MKNFYSYIAVFDFAEDGISIEFPDLPGCISCADSYEEAYASAEEALALHLYGMEQDKEVIPEPSKLNDIEVDDRQKTALIRVNMNLMRAKIQNRTVNKTVTLPAYMNEWGEEHGINFSKLLQNAIYNMMEDNQEPEPKADELRIESKSVNYSTVSQSVVMFPYNFGGQKHA
jgi:predicted RNase H-like HicB family nuclease